MADSSGAAAGMKDAKDAIDRFYDYLQSVLDVYIGIVPVLRDEAGHISRDDIAALDETLKRQQAMLLKTKSFESRIAEHMDRLGIKAPSLSATIPQLPEEEQFRFYAFLGEFDQVMEQVGFYREKCRELLQSKLYVIDKRLAEAPGEWSSVTYDERAGEVSKPLRSKNFEKKA
jgi:hypothetical protein